MYNICDLYLIENITMEKGASYFAYYSICYKKGGKLIDVFNNKWIVNSHDKTNLKMGFVDNLDNHAPKGLCARISIDDLDLVLRAIEERKKVF